jgi:hypothetical protein
LYRPTGPFLCLQPTPTLGIIPSMATESKFISPKNTAPPKVRVGEKHIDGDQPWLPGANEPVFHYYLFKYYLDQGPARTVERVQEEFKYALHKIKALAVEREWDRRCHQYETHMAELEFRGREVIATANAEEWERRRGHIRESAFHNAERLIDKAVEMLKFPLETVTESEIEMEGEDGQAQIVKTVVHTPARWNMRDAAALLKEANQLQRLAADMSTSNTAITIQQRRVDLTIQMVLQHVNKGATLEQAKMKLLDAGIEEQDLDIAIQKVQSEMAPSRSSANQVGGKE